MKCGISAAPNETKNRMFVFETCFLTPPPVCHWPVKHMARPQTDIIGSVAVVFLWLDA